MGKFGLGVQNEAEQRLTECCPENAWVMVSNLFQQHKRRLYTWTSPDGQYWNQIDYIICVCVFIIYFNWRLITLEYCGGFCHTLKWISHGCTCVPHPEPPFYLPPHPIPQGHPSAPALRTLSHALNLDWQSISHMIIYMFQCYSLK